MKKTTSRKAKTTTARKGSKLTKRSTARPRRATNADQVTEITPVEVELQTAEPAPTKAPKAKRAKKAKAPASARESKRDLIMALIQRPGGATLAEIMKEAGWQAHSVRGFMAGTVKKLGHTVTSSKNEAGERTYAIA